MPLSPRLLRPRASGGGFDPRSIPSIGGWWDASIASSVTLNGSNVSRISDLSGNGLHLINNTAAAQPAYTTAGRNGLNVIEMSGSKALHFNIANTGSMYTISSQSVFWVFFPAATQALNTRVFTQQIAGNADFAGTNHLIPTFFNTAATLAVYANGSTQASLSVTAGAPLVVSLVHTGSAFNHRANRGTAASGTSTLNNTAFSNCSFGGGGATTGGIGECIIYNNLACSEEQRTTVERYLAAKWGITIA